MSRLIRCGLSQIRPPPCVLNARVSGKLESVKILIISDGIPGHVNRAKGVAQLIASHIEPSEICVLEVKLIHKWLRPLLKIVLNNQSPMASTLISFAYKIDSITHVEDFDLLISAGGNTSFLNAELGAREGIKNLFMGSLRNLSADLFSAVLTLEPIHSGNDIVMNCPPSLTTYEKTHQAAMEYRRHHHMGEKPLWLMIIGGNGAGCRFTLRDWIALAEGMHRLAERYQITWLLTTSRRTGLRNEAELKRLIPPTILLNAVWYNHKPEKVMQAYLGLAENVFCTIDSMSMITEAISSCVKTNSLAPKIADLDARDQDAMDKFSTMKLLQKVKLDDLSNYAYPENELDLKSLVESHYQKLAADIKNILV
ncbi:MAG TPA: hypothetical protein EYO59_11560 [Chromatiaceae bacterium]|nr:hypothetical protein [Chromatiaceae bacterium]